MCVCAVGGLDLGQKLKKKKKKMKALLSTLDLTFHYEIQVSFFPACSQSLGVVAVWWVSMTEIYLKNKGSVTFSL